MSPALDKHYLPPSTALWSGRKDSLAGERFFQVVEAVDLTKRELIKEENAVALIGFQCDEGVKRNFGREGAKLGPDVIRQHLGTLPVHRSLKLFDIGNIQCIDDDLDAAQQALAELIDYSHQKNINTIVLGGGHEIAWAHYLGLKQHYPELAIINFDAHFDLREHEKPSSGTPFLQIANDKAAQSQSFHYCCVGIQHTANTASLFQTAKQLDVSYLTASTLYNSSLAWQQAFLDDFLNQHSHVYLSICLDVFNQAFAPGVSAPQPFGLSPSDALPLIDYIMQSEKVISVDIAELSPPYDRGSRTARLASHIAATLI